jgi:hypothetical protein
MIGWVLLSLCGAYFVLAEPHIAAGRKRLAERSRFFHELIRCIPCALGWSGAFTEAFLHRHTFVPDWLDTILPWWATDALAPPIAAAAAIGLGYLVMVVSPMALIPHIGKAKANGEKTEG